MLSYVEIGKLVWNRMKKNTDGRTDREAGHTDGRRTKVDQISSGEPRTNKQNERK